MKLFKRPQIITNEDRYGLFFDIGEKRGLGTKAPEALLQFRDHPLDFVMAAYDWENDESLHIVELQEPWRSRYGKKWGPDAWACQLFDDIAAQVKANAFDGRIPVKPIREAVASGHGIGKTAVVAMCVDWIMSTRPRAKGTITAGSYRQLETKTWPEIVKWTKRCVTRDWFEISTAGLWMRHKSDPDGWRCDAISCAKENSDSFQGQHAADSTSFYIFDESSAVPHEIWEAASGGLTDGEPMWFAFGNPLYNSGDFKDCFSGRTRTLWNTRQIDSRDCSLPNKEYIKDLIDTYGLDSDYVKVRVLGQFPSLSANQFISVADVEAAFGKVLRPDQYNFAPKILTCDPAWSGDDELVIGMRQGLYFQILRVMPKNDNDIMVANILANIEDQEECDAVFVDGGFGTGIISAGRTMGRDWTLVWFSEASSDPGCLNKRADMWNSIKKWLKEGGAIPRDQRLFDDLTGVEIIPRMDGKIQLEAKKDMKRRGLPSPGRGDVLALSFAAPVRKKAPYRDDFVPHRRTYDPLRHFSAR